MSRLLLRGPWGLLAFSVASYSLLAEPGAAAAAAESRGLEEIVVTARLREQSLQSVPLSIAAFGEQDLQDRGIASLEELAAYLPGVDFASSGAINSRRIIIRGLSQQTRVGDEVNVATFVDGVFTPGFSGTTVLFDAVERVEVIRGPQSALYGRNSFAGTVNYVLRKPADELGFGVRGTLGNYDRQALSAYVTGPVLGDLLTARVDVAHNESGGTNTNEVTGNALGSTKTDFFRLALRSRVADWVEVNAALSYQEDEFNPAAQTIIGDFDARRVGVPFGSVSPFELGYILDQTGAFGPQLGRRVLGRITDTSEQYFQDELAGGTRESLRASVQIDFDLGPVTLTSLTGYQDRETLYISDLDTTPDGTFFWLLVGQQSPIGFYQTGSGPWEDRQEISQDLRISSNGEGPVSWLAGLYYSHEDFRDRRVRFSSPALIPASGNITSPQPPPQVSEDNFLDNTFASVYAAVDIDLPRDFNLALEGRYTRERKRSDNVAIFYPQGNDPVGVLRNSFSYFTPRVIGSWEPRRGRLGYALVAKGVKSGGFNPSADEGEQLYDTEENWTYELGTKLAFFEQRLQLNTAIYYVDWRDQQILTFGASNLVDPIFANVGKSEVKGLEFDSTLLPVDWLTLNIAYAYTDSQYKDALFRTSAGWSDCAAIGVECAPAPGSPTGVASTGRVDGKQLQNTSKHSFNLGGQLEKPAGYQDWDVFLRGDYLYKSRRYVDEGNIGYIPGSGTVNLRIGLRNPEWSAEGFCNNMFKDDTPSFAFPYRDFGGVPHFAVVNRNERMCGLTLSYTWRGQ